MIRPKLYALALTPSILTFASVAAAMPFAAGGKHTCVLDTTDTIRCFGDNASGQLGDGSRGAARAKPEPVTRAEGMLGIIEVVAGGAHTCARTLVGAVFCWGDNGSGQLGSGTLGVSARPVQVVGLPPVVQIAAGGNHTCAVGNDGAVYCWGSNDFGESLGNTGTTTPSPARMYRAEGSHAGALSIATGIQHTCIADEHALSGGQAFCWGRLSEWQTGYRSPADAGPFWSTPIRIPQTSAGQMHSCALDVRGEIRCTGEYGDVRRNVVASGAPSGFWSLNALQITSGRNFTCALRFDGTVACWGDDALGQLGNGPGRWAWRTGQQVAVTVQGVSDAIAVSAGEEHACAMTERGQLQCWGRGTEGQLGDGKLRNTEAPVRALVEETTRLCMDASCPLRCPDGLTQSYGACRKASK